MIGAAVAERNLTLVHDEARRAKTLRGFNRNDRIFRIVTLGAAVTVLALLAGVMIALLHGSLPAWRGSMREKVFASRRSSRRTCRTMLP